MADRLGALFAVLDPSDVAPDEFNDWYDTEHIPERLEVPGVLGASRWLSRDGGRTSVVCYDLERLSVLESPEYRAIAGDNFSPWSKRIIGKCSHFGRYEAEQLVPGDRVAPDGGGGLFFVAMNVDPAIENEFNRWYDEEHLPRLAQLDGVLAARRYRAPVGPQRYVAVYHLEAPEVVGSPEWLEAAETDWTHRIRPRTSDRVMIVCTPYERAED